MNTGTIVIAVGVLAIAAYFIYNATQSSGDSSSAGCSGIAWIDAVNPFCYVSEAASGVSNEVNTILIILALVVVLVVGLLAFGPQTQHIARASGAFLA
jgi:hypothetical protein